MKNSEPLQSSINFNKQEDSSLGTKHTIFFKAMHSSDDDAQNLEQHSFSATLFYLVSGSTPRSFAAL